MHHSFICAIGVFFLFIISDLSAKSIRPSIIQKSIENGDKIFYFGIGSNMLKSKIMNRGVNGSTISIKSMIPAKVLDYRLAFNMRGFVPIEPAMAGIEPCEGSVCHGALIELDASEYEKLWISEGGSQDKPGYEEVLIQVLPYNSHRPVIAIALRASSHVRMKRDAEPSQRYMNILIQGATELGLEKEYILKLQNIQTAQPSLITTWLARRHLLFTSFLFRYRLRNIQRMISSLLWLAYVPSGSCNNYSMRKLFSGSLITIILLPGGLLGYVMGLVYKIRGKTPPSVFGNVLNKQKTSST